MAAVKYVPYKNAIAVIGDTKPYKTAISVAGGKFNPTLDINEKKTPGWIFYKKDESKVKALVDCINNGSIPQTVESSSSYSSGSVQVTKKDFMALVTRVEYLESQNAILMIKLGVNMPQVVVTSAAAALNSLCLKGSESLLKPSLRHSPFGEELGDTQSEVLFEDDEDGTEEESDDRPKLIRKK